MQYTVGGPFYKYFSIAFPILPGIAGGLAQELLKYDYPGNVKELENVIERAITLSKEDADIEEEEIFLGNITKTEDEKRINLLNISLIRRLCESHRVILIAKITTLGGVNK